MESDRDKRLREMIAKGAHQKLVTPAPRKTWREGSEKAAVSGQAPFKISSTQIGLVSSVALAAIGFSLPVEFKVAIWIVTAFLILYLLTGEDNIRQRLTLDQRWAVIFFVPLTTAFAFKGLISKTWLEEHASVTKGVLEPEDQSLSHDGIAPALALEIGDGGSFILPVTSQQGTVISSDNDAVSVRKNDKGEVLFCFTAKDETGHTIVQVIDNDWVVDPERSVSWDKNYNSHALEVLDSRRIVILQVHLYRNGVRFQGQWDKGRSITEEGKEDLTSGITELFRFPSSTKWGEFSGAYSTNPDVRSSPYPTPQDKPGPPPLALPRASIVQPSHSTS